MSDKKVLFYGIGALVVAAIPVAGFIMWERSLPKHSGEDRGNVEFVDARKFADAFTEPEKPVVALWYANWCGHCRTAVPAFIAASKLDKARQYRWLAIESSALNDAPAHFQVEGFPTIRRYKPTLPRGHNGVWTTHKGPRTAEGFYSVALSDAQH